MTRRLWLGVALFTLIAIAAVIYVMDLGDETTRIECRKAPARPGLPTIVC